MSEIFGIGSRLKHAAFGEGVVIGVEVAAYRISFMQYGVKLVGRDYDGWHVIEKVDYDPEESFSNAEKSLLKILRTFGATAETVELGDKWQGGMMILKPESEDLKSKEIPIDTFFHKIVMVRDRIRVMEQRINSSKQLTDEEKVNLQQYITKIYGSLTTFNVLFKHKQDYFKGEKK